MELGCDAVLLATAVTRADRPRGDGHRDAPRRRVGPPRPRRRPHPPPLLGAGLVAGAGRCRTRTSVKRLYRRSEAATPRRSPMPRRAAGDRAAILPPSVRKAAFLTSGRGARLHEGLEAGERALDASGVGGGEAGALDEPRGARRRPVEGLGDAGPAADGLELVAPAVVAEVAARRSGGPPRTRRPRWRSGTARRSASTMPKRAPRVSRSGPGDRRRGPCPSRRSRPWARGSASTVEDRRRRGVDDDVAADVAFGHAGEPSERRGSLTSSVSDVPSLTWVAGSSGWRSGRHARMAAC